MATNRQEQYELTMMWLALPAVYYDNHNTRSRGRNPSRGVSVDVRGNMLMTTVVTGGANGRFGSIVDVFDTPEQAVERAKKKMELERML